MPECEFCVAAENGEKVYEDEKIFAIMSQRPASRGHVMVMPKEHMTILEQVPDFIVGKLFSAANSISTAMFEKLRAHGTNIIVENGSAAGQRVAHFSINIIPRAENDGLGFAWQPTTMSEEDMSTTELQLKEAAKSIGGFQKEESRPIEVDKKDEVVTKSEDDYMLRQLRRIP